MTDDRNETGWQEAYAGRQGAGTRHPPEEGGHEDGSSWKEGRASGRREGAGPSGPGRESPPGGFPPSGHDLGEGEEDKRAILPTALQMRSVRYFLGAALALVVTIIVLVLYRTPQCCAGLILCGWLVYLGLSLPIDWAEGKIMELAVTCTSVNHSRATTAFYSVSQQTTRAVFRSEEDPPRYYDFVLSGNKKLNADLQPNCVYVIYFRKDAPRQLLGYIQL